MTRALFVATVSETLKGFILPFVEHFRRKGWAIDGMARGISGCPSCKGSFDRVWDADWSRSPFDPRNLLGASRFVRQVVAENEYDIVHVHTPIASFATRFSLRNLRNSTGLKIIYTAHGFHFFGGGKSYRNGLYLALEKVAGNWTDYLVTINHEDFAAGVRHDIVPVQSLVYMPGIGIDLEHYRRSLVNDAEVERTRRDIGISANEKIFLMIAEFTPNKRHKDLLIAFARLDRANTHLVLAGVGPLIEQIRRLARHLNIADRVHVLGFRQDIPILLKASTALVLPSLREGLPRSVMEALCLEVPCIGSNIRGTSDLLTGGKGLLVDICDPDSLCSAMQWILDNPGDAAKMAAMGRAGMSEYDINNVLRMHENLYAKALAN